MAKQRRKTGLDATTAAGVKHEELRQEAMTDVEQAGQQAVPEGGAAVPPEPVVLAEEPADPVSQPAAEPEAAPAGEHPAADPVAAVEGPAVDMGTEAAGEDASAAAVQTAADFMADLASEHVHAEPEAAHPAKVREGRARRAAWLAYHGAADSIGMLSEAVEFEPDGQVWRAVSEFLLSHPDEPAAIPVHLALQKLGGSMAPSDQEAMLWGVFADVFKRVHRHLELVDAEAASKAAKAAAPVPSGRAQAFRPEPGPFDAGGFRPRD